MRLFLDANTIIYLVEMVEPWYEKTRQIMQELLRIYGRTEISVSALSHLECRVKPIRENNQDLLEKYQFFFTRPRLHIQSLNAQVIDRAALLRAHHGLKTPDAIQAACALCMDEEVIFVTGDRRFDRVTDLPVEMIE